MDRLDPRQAPAPPDTVPEAPALFRRYPRLRGSIPWTPLGTLPTPIEPLALDAEFRAAAELWVKRDDLTGLRYGGNKVRKLEFLLARARKDAAERVVTAGATGSHHALATTVYATALGLDVSLVLFPQSRTPHVRRVLLQNHLLGAELRWTPRMVNVPLAVLGARWAHRAERVVVVPPGGSDSLGTLGYVSGALELVEQIESGQAPVPDVVHVAGGTLGTAAGLALGFAMAGLPTRVAAARITSSLVTNERTLQKLVGGAAALLGEAGVDAPVDSALARVALVHDHIGAGYGRATPEGEAAGALLAGAGLTTDPTYTAKAAAALVAGLPAGGVHLFWHTLSAAEPLAELPADAEHGLPEPFRHYLAGTRE